MAAIHWGMRYPHVQKIPKYCLAASWQLLQEAASMEQQWCAKTPFSICPQKAQYLKQFLMQTGQLTRTMSYFFLSVWLLNE
jgi:hypothetical protein